MLGRSHRRGGRHGTGQRADHPAGVPARRGHGHGRVGCGFTEDGTFTDESIGVTWKGPAELPVQVENYHGAFPDKHRELYQVYVGGNIVVVQLALQGTYQDPLNMPGGTLAPTG